MIGIIIVGILVFLFLIIIRRRIVKLFTFWKKNDEERVPVVNFSKNPATPGGSGDTTVPLAAAADGAGARPPTGDSYQDADPSQGGKVPHVTINLSQEGMPKNSKFQQPAFRSSIDLVKAYLRSFTD